MKKTYISPETLIVKLSLRSSILIAGSVDDDIVPGGQTAGTKEYAGEEGSTGGKNVWDEEW